MERRGRKEADRFLDFVPVFAGESERYILPTPGTAKGVNDGSNHELDAKQLVRIGQSRCSIYVSFCRAVVRAENPENLAGFAATGWRVAAAFYGGRLARAVQH